MGMFSIWHLVAIAVIALLLFGGRGKLSGLMGDAAQGIRAFRDGLKDPNAPSETTSEQTPATPPQPAPLPEPARENETAR
jgi:sec-independent protein translocase protein TatA